jgi:hypothetical protein
MLIKQISLILIVIGALSLSVNAQVLPKKGNPPQWIYGLTIEELDELDVKKFEESFRDVPVPITLRIVFQNNTKPEYYEAKLRQLRNPPAGGKKFNIVGLPFDATALKNYQLAATPDENFDCKTFQESDPIYDHRAKCFVEYYTGARDYIDAWEVGNEVNGEWADEDYKKSLPPGQTPGQPKKTIDKISRLINFIPVNKPLMLTLSYMPKCFTWPTNAMDKWVENFRKHMPQQPLDRIDYVLISYYENNCNFHLLTDSELHNDVFGKLLSTFPDQFLGIGEVGYSDGDDEGFKSCGDDCYCSRKKIYCNEADAEAGNGKISKCKKSKISQMQRYYGLKPGDAKYIGGGFWWNAGKDYKVKKFREALKNQFTCLATGRSCETPLPVDCH